MALLGKRLSILTWQVHGHYLHYLSQVPHDFHLVTKAGHPPGYAGKAGQMPFGDNVQEVPIEKVPGRQFDVVLYQHRSHYMHDRLHVLTPAQRALPRIYLEHDPPQEDPFAQLHWAQDPGLVLVHVTHFNRLMWDNGRTPTTVIEHGVVVPEGVRYTGELERGIVIVNHLLERGRRVGADVFEAIRRDVPLDLVGTNAKELGGIGAIGRPDLAAFSAPYRFLFNPLRWTSLGLAVVEAMAIGMPIVGLATTEMSTVIRNGDNGFIHADPAELRDAMLRLLRDKRLAESWGEGARRTARERYSIERFVADWTRVLADVTG